MQDLLPQLERLLKQKRSRSFYAEKLGVSEDEVKELIKELKLREKEEYEGATAPNEELQEASSFYRKVNNERGSMESTTESTFEPKSDQELAELHKIDLSKYKISNYWSKVKPNGKFTSSVFCTLIKTDTDLEAQKEVLLRELSGEMPYYPVVMMNFGGEYAYEISLPDVHFGKLAWDEESGEDYDLDIAEKRFETAVQELLSLVNRDKLDKIIFPIGNDMINIDSRRNETFAGTRQDCDSRFFKMVRTAKEILIKTINSLSRIASVDVIVVAGNHDSETMFMIGEILDAYYSQNGSVTIDNSASQRKYYQYGLNSFQYTHGNEESHKDLGLIFATERPQLWADTKYRFCKLGHFHKNKKIDYVSVDEYQGFQVQILPSLSGSDAWHSSKGYNSLKQAKGFLYHREKGKIAEYTYTV